MRAILKGRLIIVSGLPGSGKTTLAYKLEAAFPSVRLSADDWMVSLHINLHAESERDRIETLQWHLAQRLLELGNVVIVEWGTWGKWDRDRLRLRAREIGASVEIHSLTAPLEELYRRIQLRNMEDPPISWETVQKWGSIFEAPTREELDLFDPPLLSNGSSIANEQQEEHLTGGNTAESVLRLGSTVRKPATASTPAVHSFLKHLRAAGYGASPDALGLDEQGRQVLEFAHGPLWTATPRTQTDLHRVGAMIRALHNAAVSFQVPEAAQWNTRYETDGHELICHNDLAPWNLVCGADRWVFIDWDAAAPATRLWDLAWASISFPPIEPECDLTVASTAMHSLLDGYRLETTSYGDLIRLMATRARAEYEFIVEGARAEQQPWAKLYIEGHHKYWGPVADYIDRHASDLNHMLMALNYSTPKSR